MQMDNCARENKNKYVLAYLCYLVKCNLFKKIYINFLKVGHTHCDVDALFKLISNIMNKTNVATIEELHDAAKIALCNTIKIMHVEHMPHITKYMEDNKLLNPIVGFIYLFLII